MPSLFIRKFLKLFFPKKRMKRFVLCYSGKHYNLKEIYDKLNAQYFESKLDLNITWVGNRNSTPRVRLMFGSYHREKKLIKIHRRLDQAHVPYYFISFVVYHEMLHHVLPPLKEKNQRRRIHHPAFIEKEKQFQEYALSQEFQKVMRASWFKRMEKV